MSTVRLTQMTRQALNQWKRPKMRVTQMCRQVLHDYTCITPGASTVDSCPETLMEDQTAASVFDPLHPDGTGDRLVPPVTSNPDITSPPTRAFPKFLSEGSHDRPYTPRSAPGSFVTNPPSRPIRS